MTKKQFRKLAAERKIVVNGYSGKEKTFYIEGDPGATSAFVSFLNEEYDLLFNIQVSERVIK